MIRERFRLLLFVPHRDEVGLNADQPLRREVIPAGDAQRRRECRARARSLTTSTCGEQSVTSGVTSTASGLSRANQLLDDRAARNRALACARGTESDAGRNGRS